MFSLSNIVSAGMNLLFGSPGKPTGSGPPVGPGMGKPTSGLFGSGGGLGGGFIDIKKGAKALLKSQGLGGPDGTGNQQYFQTTEFTDRRSVQELTRGQAVGRVQLTDIQQKLYNAPEVRRYAEYLRSSQNNQIRNLRAATGVETTLRQGRKTLATETPELQEIDV